MTKVCADECFICEAERSRNMQLVPKYLRSNMLKKSRSDPPMGRALSQKLQNGLEGLDTKDDPPFFTDAKVFWKRINSKEEGAEAFRARFPEASG